MGIGRIQQSSEIAESGENSDKHLSVNSDGFSCTMPSD